MLSNANDRGALSLGSVIPPMLVAQHSEDRYPEGSLHRQPVDDHVRRFRFAFHPEYRQKKTSQWKRLLPKLMAEDAKIVV